LKLLVIDCLLLKNSHPLPLNALNDIENMFKHSNMYLNITA